MSLSGTNTRRKALFTGKFFWSSWQNRKDKNMANRNIDKLYSGYKDKFLVGEERKRRAQLTCNDFYGVRRVAKEKLGSDDLYSCIQVALYAGVMVGYNVRKAEEKQRSK